MVSNLAFQDLHVLREEGGWGQGVQGIGKGESEDVGVGKARKGREGPGLHPYGARVKGLGYAGSGDGTEIFGTCFRRVRAAMLEFSHEQGAGLAGLV